MSDGNFAQPALHFGFDSQLKRIAQEFGTPLFVHHELSYRRQGRQCMEAPNAFGLSVRYAMKANPHRAILRVFDRMGIGMEIEPGTYLAANACILLARINDIVDTGTGGYRFLKLDASMTELLRPMMYGDRHPIRLLGRDEGPTMPYVVVGTCCESGDIFTPEQGNPEKLDTVLLPMAVPGDIVAVMGVGAYGSAMSAKNYNSRPTCAEVMIHEDGSYRRITRAEEPEEVWDRELD
jgi:diaminopimelate decarboxylase